MTYPDYNNRVFHVFDTETREIEFIHNPHTIFKKLMYDDTNTNYDNFDITEYNQKFIKLVVVNKKDNQMFDRLLDRLYKNISVHELKILEDYSDLNHTNDQLPVDLMMLKVMIKEMLKIQ